MASTPSGFPFLVRLAGAAALAALAVLAPGLTVRGQAQSGASAQKPPAAAL